MTWDEEVFSFVTSDTKFFNFAKTNLFPDVAPSGQAAPFFVWQEITGGGSSQHDGPCDVSNPIIQYACWAGKRSLANEGREILKDLLSSKVLPPDEYDIAFTYSNELSTYDSETKLFGAILELRAHIKKL